MEWGTVIYFLHAIGCLTQYVQTECAETPADGTDDLPFQVSGSCLLPKPCDINFKFKYAICRSRNYRVVPDNLPSDLGRLSLLSNYIQALHNSSFRSYTLLKELLLGDNNITFIETGTFFPLTHLLLLDLSRNIYLHKIDSEMFKFSANLVALDIPDANLLFFPNETLRWLPQLQRLNLYNNQIKFINFTFCPKTSLGLGLINNQIEAITNETFNTNCNFEVLEISSNPLCFVDQNVIAHLHVSSLSIGKMSGFETGYTVQVYKDLFAGIAQSSIKRVHIFHFDFSAFKTFKQFQSDYPLELSIHGSYIREVLNQSTFMSLKSLKKLGIYTTNLAYIQPELFNVMNDLKELNLPGDKLFLIDTGSSSWKINLRSLNLSLNNLRYINSHAFVGLNSLLSLDLFDNPLVGISFKHLTNLRYLNISRTGIIKVTDFQMYHLWSFSFTGRKNILLRDTYEDFLKPNETFKSTQSLKRIDMSNSRVELYEIWNRGENISLFYGLTKLELLDLHDNKVMFLENGMFPYLPSLIELNIGRCKIRKLEEHVFIGLNSLSILHLDYNEIIRLPPTLFKNTRQLQSLYIERNFLSYLDEDVFVTTPVLSHLTLFGNELISLNRNTFSPVQFSLKSLDISNNPFDCSCHLKWLVEWLKDSNDVLESNKATCSPGLGKRLTGELLIMVDPLTLCNSYIALYTVITIIGISSLIVILIVYYNRWPLRYKLFLLKLAVFGYREIKDARVNGDFQYDLNIIFTGADQLWAKEYLSPNLKNYLPQLQRIAFGDNDLPLGMYYLDAVLFVIEQSFKTILIVSRAAMRDDEFMMKTRIALNHMTSTNMHNTMFLFLENIPEEEMPYLVKLSLSENMPYIIGDEDARSQSYFWKQLIKSLLVNRRRNDMVPPE